MLSSPASVAPDESHDSYCASVSAQVAESYTRSGVENPARFLKDNLAPTLNTRYGLSSADVSIERVQINNVTKN